MDHYVQLGELYKNWKTARSTGVVPANTPYNPVLEKGIGPVRTLSCYDNEGKRIESIGGIEVKIDIDPIKGNWEVEALGQAMADQKKQVDELLRREAGLGVAATEPIFWATWAECANDIVVIVVGAATIWMFINIDWKLLWHYWGF